MAVYWRHQAGADWILQVRVRPPGGPFGPIEDLSQSGSDADSPVLDIGPGGTITALWISNEGMNSTYQSRTRPSGGTWGPIENLTPVLPGAGTPALAIGPDGTTTASWNYSNGTDSIVRARTRPPGGGFGPEVLLSEPGENAGFSQVATAPDGTTTVVWTRNNGGSDRIQARTRPAGGPFGPVEDLGLGTTTARPQIDLGADGTLGVVWLAQDVIYQVVRAVIRPPGGSFGPAADLSASGASAGNPQLAVGPDGTTTAIWTRSDGADDIVQTRPVSPTGQLGMTTDLSLPRDNAFNPEIAIGPDTTAIAVWARSVGTDILIQSSSRAPGGAFGGVRNLSVTGQNFQIPLITVGPDGMATAVWNRIATPGLVYSISTLAPEFTLAVFVPEGARGTVTSAPAGIDCGKACLADFPSYTRVTLTATPRKGAGFNGWSGACEGVAKKSCELSIDEAKAVGAAFGRKCPPKKLKTGKLKRNRRKGIARLKVIAGGKGKVILKGSKKVKKASRKVGSNGKGKLAVKARGRVARALKKKGTVGFKVKLLYRPGGGCPKKTVNRKVKLVRR